ncbi:3-oxoacyl-[acyl-carrier-protein] synthase 3 A, chloroplastic [Benincasa hispida]|uniref:3-oxoacyl-[acyl-carrier-protein] synthase 3 A, chloroplastic n=1 Tax=Benincasa hispida TaxID=102211 RepID=UPI0018FFDB4F|nr:3-oxoacyl-[acyl-carrier-protein] synthase 3 A, chloroplastic [Benincasa hispida]
MANTSGFFATSVPSLRTRNLPLGGSFRSGFRSSDGISKAIFCSSSLGAEKVSSGASPSESRVPRIVNRGCKLVGCGSAVPSLKISNDDLAKLVDTNDEWISVRTGIRNRRVIAGKDSSLTALAAEAARGALQMAQVEPDDVDLVLMCTSTPEDLFGNAPQVQKALGCKKNPLSYDITAACSGFLLGLVSAACHIRGGGFSNVLVIGADALSRYVDWSDRASCILFGDAAGAVLLQACDTEDDGLFGFDLHSDGDGQRHLNAGIKEKESDQKLGSNGSVAGFPPKNVTYSCIHMNGKEVFRFAVRCVPQSIEAALQKAGLNASNIDWLLLHQANQRIIDAVAARLEVPSERVISNLANYGNTSAASIPLALDEAVRSGKVKAGHTIATSGFGAGLTWGSAILRWG